MFASSIMRDTADERLSWLDDGETDGDVYFDIFSCGVSFCSYFKLLLPLLSLGGVFPNFERSNWKLGSGQVGLTLGAFHST
jgi:hypothetical protein